MSQLYVVGHPARQSVRAVDFHNWPQYSNDPHIRRQASEDGSPCCAVIFVGGCLLLAVLALAWLALASIQVSGGLNADRAEGNITSWEEAARKTSLHVYKPTHVPDGSGTPTIVPIGLGGFLSTVTATYSGGLSIMETNKDFAFSSTREWTTVAGADEAAFTDSGGSRSLVVRRGETWVQISGVSPDSELIRIGESLQLVEG